MGFIAHLQWNEACLNCTISASNCCINVILLGFYERGIYRCSRRPLYLPYLTSPHPI